MNKQTAEQKI